MNNLIKNYLKLNISLNYALLYLLQFLIFSLIVVYLKIFKYSLVLVSIPVAILYLITVISFIDRSLTVQMLLLYANNDLVTLQSIFELDSLSTTSLISMRLEEQQNSGLIKLIENDIHVTNRGKLFTNVYKYFSNFYS
jgi:hypothetical protein